MDQDKKYVCQSCGNEMAEMPADNKCGCGGDVKMSCGCQDGSHSESCCKSE